MGTFSLIIVKLLELIAAIAGTVYIRKYRDDIPSRYFMYFLWLTFLVEIVGLLPNIIHRYNTVSELCSLENSFWSENFWLYNPYLILSILFYIFYIKMNIGSKIINKILLIILIFYGISSLLNLLLTDVFIASYSAYSFVLGSIFLFLAIGFYFYQILQSNDILNFGKSIPFYFSIGTLVFHLCVTPLFIYSKYYSAKSPEFVYIYALILTIANIFMYTCYIFGFVVCYRKNKSYS